MPSSSPPQAVLHVGLAKTATTSLQRHFFPLTPAASFTYIGTAQPRSRHPSPAYTAIMATLNSPTTSLVARMRIAQARLAELSLDKPVLFSEEMVTVDGPLPWQEKVARLGEIFAGHAATILITIREPVSGLYSLYVELFRDVVRQYPTFETFCSSNQANIYDFRLLDTVVRNAFPTATPIMIPFEALKPGGSFLQRIADALQIAPPINHLPRENSTKCYLGRHVRIPPLTTKNALERLSYQDCSWIMRKAGQTALRLLARAGYLPAKIPLPWTARLVPLPRPGQKLQRYSDSNAWLLRNYGIDYCK